MNVIKPALPPTELPNRPGPTFPTVPQRPTPPELPRRPVAPELPIRPTTPFKPPFVR